MTWRPTALIWHSGQEPGGLKSAICRQARNLWNTSRRSCGICSTPTCRARRCANIEITSGRSAVRSSQGCRRTQGSGSSRWQTSSWPRSLTREDRFSPTSYPRRSSALSTRPAASSCAFLKTPEAAGASCLLAVRNEQREAPGEMLTLCPIHLFDRDHPSAPTCVRSSPSCRAAVKDGALQRHRRLVLDGSEHGGMLNAQRARRTPRDDSADLSARIQTRSAQGAELQ
jgi:hypothetical protein